MSLADQLKNSQNKIKISVGEKRSQRNRKSLISSLKKTTNFVNTIPNRVSKHQVLEQH